MSEGDKEWFDQLDEQSKGFVARMLSPVGLGYRWMDACDKGSEYSDQIARELGVYRQFTYLFFRYSDATEYVRSGKSDYGGAHIRDSYTTGDGVVGFTLTVPRRIFPSVVYPLSVTSTFCEIEPEINTVFFNDALSNIEIEIVFEHLMALLPTQEEFEKISNDRWPDMVLWRSTVLRENDN